MSHEESFFANVSDATRFREALRRFDELNAADPNRESVDGSPQPRELIHALRLSNWVMTLAPDASEVLRLAARSQHLCRWEIPRTGYEMTRAGYHQWRTRLKKFHAEKSADVLRAVSYPEEIVMRVQDLNLKKNFPADPESRVLEDALCLVFLQFQFVELAGKTDAEKVVNALRKSWQKMTPAGHDHALKLYYGARERELLERALNEGKLVWTTGTAQNLVNQGRMNWVDYEPFFLMEILILLGIGILLATLASLPRRFLLKRYCQFALYGAELGMILSVIMLAMTAELLQQQGALNHFWTKSGRFVQWIVLLTPSEGGLAGVLCGIAWARIKRDRNKTEAASCG